MRHVRPWFLAAALSAGCCTRSVTPSPPCDLCRRTDLSLAPPPEREQELVHLGASGLFDGLSDADTLTQCTTAWQDQIETQHCSAATQRFCSDVCPTGQVSSCQTTPRSELVMQHCREQSQAAFARAIPACANLRWCGSRFIPATAQCDAAAPCD